MSVGSWSSPCTALPPAWLPGKRAHRAHRRTGSLRKASRRPCSACQLATYTAGLLSTQRGRCCTMSNDPAVRVRRRLPRPAAGATRQIVTPPPLRYGSAGARLALGGAALGLVGNRPLMRRRSGELGVSATTLVLRCTLSRSRWRSASRGAGLTPRRVIALTNARLIDGVACCSTAVIVAARFALFPLGRPPTRQVLFFFCHRVCCSFLETFSSR